MFFKDSVDFNNATFAEYAHFFRTGFREDVNFEGTRFGGGARFSRTTFKRADFSHARFDGPAKFLCRAQELALDGAEVSRSLTVEAAAGKVEAGNLRVGGRISMRLRAARVDLSGLVCNGPVSVQALQQPLDWDEFSLADPVTGVPPVRLISLAGVDAGRLVLTDVDLTECRFAGMHRMDELFLDGSCVFARDPRGVRQVLAEEGYWRATRQLRWPKPQLTRVRTATPIEAEVEQAEERWSQESRRLHRWIPRTRPRWTPAPTGTEVVSPARLQVMYRQLRKAIEDAKNEPGAADFYYGEMEMRRHTRTSPRADRAIIWLYWLISGYGLRALRSLAAVAVVGVIVGTALTGWGLASTAPVATAPRELSGTVTNIPGRSALINATLTGIPSKLPPPDQRWTTERTSTAVEVTLESFVFRSTDQPLTTAGTWTTIAARILGPLLLALALLAVRNRVKR